MSAMCSIFLPVTGGTTAFDQCNLIQLLVPNSIALLVDTIFHKSSCYNFLRERVYVRSCTLGYAACPVIGVTTLGSNGILRDGFTLDGIYDLV
jgi:hypothetical protein